MGLSPKISVKKFRGEVCHRRRLSDGLPTVPAGILQVQNSRTEGRKLSGSSVQCSPLTIQLHPMSLFTPLNERSGQELCDPAHVDLALDNLVPLKVPGWMPPQWLLLIFPRELGWVLLSWNAL